METYRLIEALERRVALIDEVEAVAYTLERLYADHDYRRDLGARARENADNPLYSWKTIGEQWATLFQSVLQS